MLTLIVGLGVVGYRYTGQARSSKATTPQQILFLSIQSIEVTEGDTGTVNAQFTVTLSPAAFFDVRVFYMTSDDTALAGRDYTPVSGFLTFPGTESGGNATQTIAVPIIGDNIEEPTEKFRLTLSNPSPLPYVGIANGVATCTILDNDFQPGIVILDTEIIEGDSGTRDAVFRVGVNSARTSDVTFDYETSNLSAVAGRDYQSSSGTMTIPATSNQTTVSVPIIGDTLPERTQAFFVKISNVRGAPIQDGEAVCAILDDDDPEEIRVCSTDVPKMISSADSSDDSSRINIDRDLIVDELEVSVFFSTFKVDRYNHNEPGRGGVALDSPSISNTTLFFLNDIEGFGSAPISVPVGTRCSPTPDCVITTNGAVPIRTGNPPYAGQWFSSGLFGHLGTNARGEWKISPLLMSRSRDEFFTEGSGQLECWCLRITGPREGIRLHPSRATVPVFESIEGDNPFQVEIIAGHKVMAVLNSGSGPAGGVPVIFTIRDRGGEGNVIHSDSTITDGNGRAFLSYRNWVPGTHTIEVRAEVDGAIYTDIARVTWTNPCAATEALQATSSKESTLDNLRQFRDSRLAKSKRGQRYSQLYYRFSSEAVQMMMLNPMMVIRSQQMIERYMPVLEDMTAGRDVTLTEGDLAEIDSFLSYVSAKGSRELQETVKGLKKDLRNGEVHREFGIKITPGARRETPSRGGILSMKQAGTVTAFFGLLAFLGYCFTGNRRRKAKKYFRVWLCLILGVLLTGYQWPSVRDQGAGGSQNASAITEPSVSNSQQTALNRAVDNLPARFEANQGQADSRIKFISRGKDYNLFLAPDETTLTLPDQESAAALSMKLIGANPDAKITGVDQLATRTSYYSGRDSAGWRANVPSYAKVKYKQVYDGVDLLYYGRDGHIEYDFIVAPGADLAAIRFAVEGAESVSIDAKGDLLLHTPAGELRHRKPVIYQESAGVRRPIEGEYSLIQTADFGLSTSVIGFNLGDYDPLLPLVIDPVLEYSTYLGGSGDDQGTSIAVDSQGNVYVVGITDSIDLPTASASQPQFGGGQDVFVAKLDPTGTRLEYLTYLGGSDLETATGLAIDASGNAYVAGFTRSTNFPTLNPMQATNRGQFNGFVSKLSAAGNLVYSTYLGGSLNDSTSAVAVDSAGNCYIAGIATSANFPVINAVQANQGGASDLYIAKLNASGNQLIYSTYLGGSQEDAATGIAVDPSGNVYVTGATLSVDFRTASPAQAEHGGGIFDAFVIKMNPAGNQLVYSTYLGGGSADRGFRIAVDSSGAAYVVGDTFSTDFPVRAAIQQTVGGSADAFIAKLNANGGIVYSTWLGGSEIDGGTAISVDATGAAYVTGFTESGNFPVSAAFQRDFGGGGLDAFVTKFTSNGSALEYSTYLGGRGADSGFGIVTGSQDRAYVMGLTDSPDFPTMNSFQAANNGGASDMFIAKIRPGPAIERVEIKGKNVLMTGSGFQPGAKILLDGAEQKTSVISATSLKGKKLGKKIGVGDTVRLQVRNPDGVLSNELEFRRP